jgi:serine protease
MNFRLLGSALVLTALTMAGVAPAAVATETESFGSVSGIIVEYAKGVEPFAKNGEPTGANLLRGVVESEHLGGNLYALKFDSEIRRSRVRDWIERMVLDSRISWAELDLEVQAASLPPKSFLVPVVTKARPASGPRSLTVATAVTASSPDRARVRLSWLTPANRYGAAIVGYRIQYSSDGGASYRTLISDTGTTERRIFLSDGIRAGVNYRFRVRAITNDGSGTNTVGAISNTVSTLVRTSPKPVIVSSGTRVGPGNVTYFEQSLSDRGGFAKSRIRYSAVAKSENAETVESTSCNETRCRFPDLLAEVPYEVEVFATNPRGSSSSKDVATVSDTYFNLQWYLTGQFGINMASAWKYAKGDNSKVVAVIDTGIREHEQISSSLTRNPDGSIYGYDFVSDPTSAADGDGEDSNPRDEGGGGVGGSTFHGTVVAGLIASAHDSLGTAGTSPGIKILPIRALGAGGGTLKDVAKAIHWAAGAKIQGLPVNRYPASVINLSLGATESVPCNYKDDEIDVPAIFSYLASKNVSVVVAAGNQGLESLSFPANCPGVIAVAASNSLGDRASYSNYGAGILLSAPGGQRSVGSTESPASEGMMISASTDEVGEPIYGLFEGTSFAAPVVSGIVALMYSMQPNITVNRVRTILSSSVKPFAESSTCSTSGGCGAGIVNAQLALAKVSALR